MTGEPFDGPESIGLPVVSLVECAQVLRTQYDVAESEIIGLLIELLQRANVTVLGLSNQAAVAALVAARALPGRPVPDVLIVATALPYRAVPLAAFDREVSRYGVEVIAP